MPAGVRSPAALVVPNAGRLPSPTGRNVTVAPSIGFPLTETFPETGAVSGQPLPLRRYEVAGDAFAALGTPLLRGRTFTAADGRGPAAVAIDFGRPGPPENPPP